MKNDRLLTMCLIVLAGIGALVVLGFVLKVVSALFFTLFASSWGIFKLLKGVIILAGIAFLIYCLTGSGRCRARHSRRY